MDLYDGAVFICDVSEEAYIRGLVARAEEEDYWDSVEALAQDAQLSRAYCRMIYGEFDDEEED